MPIYQYTAMDSTGKEKKGKVEGRNEQAVATLLKEQGMFPTGIKLISGGTKLKGKASSKKLRKKSKINLNVTIGTPKIPLKDLTLFTRELSILLDAGLPLVRSLRTLEKQSKNRIVKDIIGESATYVEGGATFSEALSRNPKSFDVLYINMIKAGESAGALEIILKRLSEFMEKAAKIRRKVKAAMVYPVVVLVIAFLVTSLLMIFIVPQFKKIFSDLLSGIPLPPVTEFVITISDFVRSKSYVIVISLIVIFFVFKLLKLTRHGAYYVDMIKYRLPLFGTIISKASIARFSRTLSTLMLSGVPVLNALLIVRNTAGNFVVSRAVQKVHDAVKEGEGMASPLGATRVFPEMVISMIEVGEETGKLPDMLVRIADTYDDEVDKAVEGLTSMIEPIMIVLMAIVVGTIVIAMFLPLIKIIENLGV